MLVNQRLAEMLCTEVDKLLQLREEDFFPLFRARSWAGENAPICLSGKHS